MRGDSCQATVYSGNQLTEADIRLFVTLIRFDEVWISSMKRSTTNYSASVVMLHFR